MRYYYPVHDRFFAAVLLTAGLIISGCFFGCQPASNPADDKASDKQGTTDGKSATDDKQTDPAATEKGKDTAKLDNGDDIPDPSTQTQPPDDSGQNGGGQNGGGQNGGAVDPIEPMTDPPKVQSKPLPAPEGAKRFSDDHEVWVDMKRKVVMVDGEICLREGPLELLACEVGSKTHESVISVPIKPSVVHTLLTLVGAETGKPVSFEPEYRPASGTEIQILVMWIDEEGESHEVDARQFVRGMQTRKALEYPWVFAGSGFEKDEFTGEEYFLADSYGDFICVSNFSTALLDLPVESSAENEVLMYEAFTDNIPPLGTKVRMTFVPKAKAAGETAGDDGAKEKAPDAAKDDSGQ